MRRYREPLTANRIDPQLQYLGALGTPEPRGAQRSTHHSRRSIHHGSQAFVSAASAARRRRCTASSSPTRKSPRDGKFIEIIGQYAPRQGDDGAEPSKAERVNYWLDIGAQPSDTVRSLLRKAGVLKARHEARLGGQAAGGGRAASPTTRRRPTEA